MLTAQPASLTQAVHNFFASYSAPGYSPRSSMKADSLTLDKAEKTIHIYSNEAFSAQPFTPESVKQIYNRLQRRLPAPYNAYRLNIYSHKSRLIEDLIPNMLRKGDSDESRLWGNVKYEGAPWVKNASRPYVAERGLEGRHLFIWPSHGRIYRDGRWKWQRPYLFCTTEDLLTQSFVYPFLFPMLENAGAVVYSPRERDAQSQTAIVDNDSPTLQGIYKETDQPDFAWRQPAGTKGFAQPKGLLTDSVMPFNLGTAREVSATTRKNRQAQATWMPNIPKAGRYAVYVSYASRPNSVPDAHYTVHHKGGRTQFIVNQTIGGGTWVYLGTFLFDEGTNPDGRVVLTNTSNHRGTVTADAVRFGGGTGQTERGYMDADSSFVSVGTSGMPRIYEAARYHAQWCGLPDTLYNTEQGNNDYFDDLRVRSNLLNHLSDGSPFNPGAAGAPRGSAVPFELALGIHSDAGRHPGDSIYGSLAICTTVTPDGDTLYPSGLSRKASNDFAALMLQNIVRDLGAATNRTWTRRELWDRNYAESRMPKVPSAILEMLSHQNFTDMKYAHDPVFKFYMARSIYKSILSFVNCAHGIKNYEVQPLPPRAFSAMLSESGDAVRLSWRARPDSLEPTARPRGYIVYTQIEGEAFNNGIFVENVDHVTLPLTRGLQHNFRVTAVNHGGESFPSETLSVFSSAKPAAKRVLIVNGFTRLSGPARIENADSMGFDLIADPGVPYFSTNAFAGPQLNFNPRAANIDEGTEAFGFCSDEWVGRTIAGNTFNIPAEHGRYIAAAGYSFSSSSVEAFSEQHVNTQGYDVIDYIAGLQCEASHNLVQAPLFTPKTIKRLRAYAEAGGSLLVSGAHIGSELSRSRHARSFAADILKYKPAGTARLDSTGFVNGLNLKFDILRKPNADHYAAIAPDAIFPADSKAFTAFAYGGGQSAGVAYPGSDWRTLIMAFPFECIKEDSIRLKAMDAILRFLTP